MSILKTNEELIAEAEALKIAQRRPEEARLPDGRTVAEAHQEFIAAEVAHQEELRLQRVALREAREKKVKKLTEESKQ
jgi:hypothetical protein